MYILFIVTLCLQMEFAFWLVRYFGSGLLFLLGLKAPGLPRRPYMLLVNEDERDVEHGAVRH